MTPCCKCIWFLKVLPCVMLWLGWGAWHSDVTALPCKRGWSRVSLKGSSEEGIPDRNTLEKRQEIVKWIKPGIVSHLGSYPGSWPQSNPGISGPFPYLRQGGQGCASELGEGSLQEATGLESQDQRGGQDTKGAWAATPPCGAGRQVFLRRIRNGSRLANLEPKRRTWVVAQAGNCIMLSMV